MSRDFRRILVALAIAAVAAFGMCVPALAAEQGSLTAGGFTAGVPLEAGEQPGSEDFGTQAGPSITVNSWAELQTQLADPENGTTFILGRNLTAPSDNGTLRFNSGSATIDLNGRAITGNNRDRVLYVGSNARLTIANGQSTDGRISRGNATEGGGIYNEGELTIDGGVISGNNAVRGGGIYNVGTVTVNGGRISGNIAATSGGGIYSAFSYGQMANTTAGSIIVNGGEISENTALAGDGGGIYLSDGFFVGHGTGTLTVKGGSISGNIARADNGAYGRGAGIACFSRLSVEGGSISGNKAFYGGGIYLGSPNTGGSGATISGGKITGNTAIAGGGICNGYGEPSGGARGVGVMLSGGEVSGNKAEGQGVCQGGGIYNNNSGYLTLAGCSVTNNETSRSGGGGGIYTKGDVVLQSGVISGNSGYMDGGGILVDAGKTTISGGEVSGNTAIWGNGGGICVSYDGALVLTGGTISGNEVQEAGNQGGGIYVANHNSATQKNAAISMQGAPVVKDNTAARSGGVDAANNVFLTSGNVIEVTGALEPTEVGVTLAGKTGRFTKDYTRIVKVDGEDRVQTLQPPSRYFTSDEGLSVSLDYTQGDYAEAVIQETRGVDLERVKSFVPDKQLFETESGKLSGNNWMAGISGERYLNEINLPATHDSGCNIIYTYDDSTKMFSFYAKTQFYHIDSQLNFGIRKLDLRLNNRYMTGYANGGFGTNWRDDGENLYICHGKSSMGAFYTRDKNGNPLSLDTILTWTKDFLRENPSETVLLTFEAELNTSSHGVNKSGDEQKVWNRLWWALYEVAQETNPSTGESYLYSDPNGRFLQTITRNPQLKDCRGKIVIDFNNSTVGGVDADVYGETYNESENKCTADDKIEKVEDFYAEHNSRIPTNVLSHLDYRYNVGTTTSGPNINYAFGWNSPVEYAEYIHEELFGPGNVFDDVGRYYGIVRLDGADPDSAKGVWRTNFPDNLEYCTVKVRPGVPAKDGSNLEETYTLMKGTKLQVPNCIYSYDTDERNMTFTNWLVSGKESGDVGYNPGQELTVAEDLTITAQWDYGATPLEVVWKDGDNADGIRPRELTVSLWTTDENGDGLFPFITLSEDEGWKTVISSRVEQFKPVSSVIWAYGGDTNNKSDGRDTNGQYRYEVSGSRSEGYVVTLYHTPKDTADASGTVAWLDETREWARPTSVNLHLFKDGEEIASTSPTAAGGWAYDFGKLPLYNNGEAIEYALVEDPVENYTTSVNEFAVSNESTLPEATTSVMGNITWDDEGTEGARPASATVRLLADGVEVASQTVMPDEESGIWVWGFNDVPTMDSEGREIDYKVLQDPAPGYDVTTLVGEGIEIKNTPRARAAEGAPAFRTHSLTLDGRIGMQFYVELPVLEGVDWGTSRVDFSVSGKGAFESSDAFDANSTNEAGTYYGFECNVASIQMADRVIATLRYTQDGTEKTAYQAYSVARYVEEFDAILAANPGAFDAGTVALVHAMADYGHYEQPYLSALRGWEIGSDYAEMPAASEISDAAVAEAREGTAPYATGYHMTMRSDRYVERLSVALDLETDTSLYVFVYTREGASVASAKLADGTVLPVERVSDNCWRATVPGIMAQHLNKEFEVMMATERGAEFSVSTSALSIARDLVRSGDANARLAGAALYNYWKAAAAYLS